MRRGPVLGLLSLFKYTVKKQKNTLVTFLLECLYPLYSEERIEFFGFRG